MIVLRGCPDHSEYVVGSTANVEIAVAAVNGARNEWCLYSSDALESHFVRRGVPAPHSILLNITAFSIELSGVSKVRREECKAVFPLLSYDIVKGPDSPSLMEPGQVRIYTARFALPTTLPPTYNGYAAKTNYTLTATLTYNTNRTGTNATAVLRIPIRVLSPISLLSTLRGPYVVDEDDLDFRLLSSASSFVAPSTTPHKRHHGGMTPFEMPPYVPEVMEQFMRSSKHNMPQEIVIRERAHNEIVATVFISSTAIAVGESMRGLVIMPEDKKGPCRVEKVVIHVLSEENESHRSVIQEVEVGTLWSSQAAFLLSIPQGQMHTFSTEFVTLKHLIEFIFYVVRVEGCCVTPEGPPIVLAVPLLVTLAGLSQGNHRTTVFYAT